MKKAFAVTAALALLCLGGLAQADVFNLGSGLTNLETVVVGDPGNNANFNYSIGSPYYRTNVGEFENSASAYGTFDQGGNVMEWNETVVKYANRGLCGGSFDEDDGAGGDYNPLRASNRYDGTPSYESIDVGFRVAEAVPEPSSIIALSGCLVSLLAFRRRKA